jgi:DNA mismatch repair ATPase MutL
MQAFALARPTIRFRLRILKAKNSNGDFVYAPKANANIEDAVLKVIGKDCALQCDWTALETDGFEIHAFLPKPGASGPKIAHQGAFVSIDARPVSTNRGTMKQIVAAYKDRLRKSTPSLAGVKDPFACMNIICPPHSYDPNIEPAKDDVMFDNSDVVISAVDNLLKAYYSEAIQDIPDLQDTDIPTSAQQQYELQPEELPSRRESSIMVYKDEPTIRNKEPPSNLPQVLPRWRSSMYGIDEDDLEFLQENQAPVAEEEEEDIRAIEVSNPWTIARMNTIVKPKHALGNEQLLSPAKSQRGDDAHIGSYSPACTPHRPSSAAPLTPQTSSRTNMRSTLDAELEHSIHHVPQLSSEAGSFDDSTRDRVTESRDRHEFASHPSQTSMSSHFTQLDVRSMDSRPTNSSQFGTSSQWTAPPVYSAPRNRCSQKNSANKPFVAPKQVQNDSKFGQYLPGTQSSKSARYQQQAKLNEGPPFSTGTSLSPNTPVLKPTERTVARQPRSNDKSDIRNFFGRSRNMETDGSPVTSANSETLTRQLEGNCSAQQDQPLLQRNGPVDDLSRASSAEPQPRSKRVKDHSLLGIDPRGMAEHFQLFSEYGSRGARLEPRNRTHQFRDRVLPQSPDSRPSMGSERHLVSQTCNQIPEPSEMCHPSQTAKEMEAYFRTQEQQHSSSPSRPQISPNRHEPRITPANETAKKQVRPRRRTTDALERKKSSKLPLERTPKGFNIRDLVLSLSTSLDAIIQSSLKLDMQRNSPKWGYESEDAYEVFREPVWEDKVMEWVIKLDELLCKRYGSIDGPDTRCEIHEGIQRALDARKEADGATQWNESMGHDTTEGTVAVFDAVSSDVGDAVSVVAQQPLAEDGKKPSNDDEFEFDLEQLVDLTEDDERQIMGTANEESVEVVKGAFDDIEDEMLMDL